MQVGAAVMLAWGDFWKRRGLRPRGFHANELIAAGAAGGLAAAFNAPLAGVIFAIEELGRGTVLRWQRLVLIGVLAAGFLVVAVAGNNPYFGVFAGAPLNQGMLMWVLVCGALNGALGGIFARLLGKGAAGAAPRRWRLDPGASRLDRVHHGPGAGPDRPVHGRQRVWHGLWLGSRPVVGERRRARRLPGWPSWRPPWRPTGPAYPAAFSRRR